MCSSMLLGESEQLFSYFVNGSVWLGRYEVVHRVLGSLVELEAYYNYMVPAQL